MCIDEYGHNSPSLITHSWELFDYFLTKVLWLLLAILPTYFSSSVCRQQTTSSFCQKFVYKSAFLLYPPNFSPRKWRGEAVETSAQTRLESMEFERIYMHFVEIIKKTDWSAVSWISVGINTPVVCSKRVEHRKNLRRSGNNNKQTIRWRRLFFSLFLKIAKSNVRSADYFLVSFFFRLKNKRSSCLAFLFITHH